jgi:hypothetical protein
MLLAIGRHPGPGPAPGSARWARAAQPDAGQAAALATVDLMRAWHGQRRIIHSRPARCRQATTPADHRPIDPPGPAGAAATPNHSGSSAARTGRRQRRGHWSVSVRTPDAPDARSPDTWMLDVRSTGWTDVSTADWTRRTRQRPGWPASGHPRHWRPPPGGPTPPGHGTWGRSGQPGRLRGDGPCAAALTAATTGQLPSTARHDAAPRRTALLG